MRFELITPVRDLAWMLDGAEGFDVDVRDVTNERAAIGVAGPLAMALLRDAGLVLQEMHAGDVADAVALEPRHRRPLGRMLPASSC